MSDLTSEQIAELLGGTRAPKGTTKTSGEPKTKFIRKATQYPAHNTKHVQRYDASLRCASRGCSAPTNLKLDGIPYCGIHIIFGLAVMVDKLEDQLEVAQKGYGML